MRLLALCAGVPMCLIAALVAAASDPLAMLDTMSRNFRALNYRGVFTYEQGQQLSSARVVHAVVDGLEQERLLQLDGDMSEFLRRDHRVDCVHAGNRLLRLGGPGLSENQGGHSVQLLAQLGNYYAIEFDGEERVATRQGRRIRISPRDAYRYGATMVLDEATSLLLKSETTDGAGRVLERFQFVDVAIGGDVPLADLRAQTDSAKLSAAHEGSDESALLQQTPFVWTVAWVPQGFELSSREERQGAPADQAVQVQTYTDGLAVFSVFVEPQSDEATQYAGHASHGATVAYMVARGPQHLVTVVGEIPVAAAQVVANSVNFPDAAL